MVDPTSAPPATTPTTTSTTVQLSTPATPPPKLYDNWGVAGLIVGGVVGTIFIITAIIGATDTVLKWLRGRQAQEHELLAPITRQISEVKSDIAKFRPGDIIDRDISRVEEDLDHHKVNMRAVHDKLHDMVRIVQGDVGALQREQERVKTQVEGMGSNITRVENAVERVGERMDERLDRIQELIIKNK